MPLIRREPPLGTQTASPEQETKPAPAVRAASTPNVKFSFRDRMERFFSQLSTRNKFWHRVCSLVWLPYAFKSGIQMKRVDAKTFTAVLPYRRFNRNWYNAMAGASLLGNAEIAGGMYVFGECGVDYTVVCKHLEYSFLRPCYGPALYRISPREDLDTLLSAGSEFNLTIDMDIVQAITGPGSKKEHRKRGRKKQKPAARPEKERRIGRCTATFHVTPKKHHKAKRGTITGQKRG